VKKLTKQGVRNLDDMKAGKSKGKKLEMPPQNAIVCKHPGLANHWNGYCYQCPVCGMEFDWENSKTPIE